MEERQIELGGDDVAVQEQDVSAEAVVVVPGFAGGSDGVLGGVFDEDGGRGGVGDRSAMAFPSRQQVAAFSLLRVSAISA